jgi:hypothetical protein
MQGMYLQFVYKVLHIFYNDLHPVNIRIKDYSASLYLNL